MPLYRVAGTTDRANLKPVNAGREVAFRAIANGFDVGLQITRETLYAAIADDGSYEQDLWVPAAGKAYYTVILPDFYKFLIQIEDNGAAQPLDVTALKYGAEPSADIPPSVLDAIAGLVTSGERSLQFSQVFSPTDNQTVFLLAQIPERPDLSQLLVNGVEQTYGVAEDYAIEGSVLTYTGNATITTDTEFKIYCFRSS